MIEDRYHGWEVYCETNYLGFGKEREKKSLGKYNAWTFGALERKTILLFLLNHWNKINLLNLRSHINTSKQGKIPNKGPKYYNFLNNDLKWTLIQIRARSSHISLK